MNSKLRNLMISAGAAAILSAPVLTAQTKLETAEIPFDFTAGETNLAAGSYSVETLNNHAVLVLRNNESGKSIIIGSPIRGSEKDRAVMAFRCYGDHCFLSEVDVPGTSSYEMSKGSWERETAKADTKATMAFVTMASR